MKKKILIISIVLIVLIIIGLVLVFIFSLNKEKGKQNDLLEVIDLYSNINSTVNYINDYSISLEENWQECIENGKFSNISDMFDHVINSEKNKLDLIETFKEQTQDLHSKIKNDNYYYLNYPEIKKSIDNCINSLASYHDFILANKELSYFSLTLQKDIQYKSCNTSLELLLLKLITEIKGD